MCGISGLARTDGKAIDVALLGKMTDLVAYRGPDDQGFLLAGADGQTKFFGDSKELSSHAAFAPTVGLGHRRLSILDLSAAGRQPMSYGDGAYWIVFNGEIFNYVELASELEAMGYKFASHTDTEVILAAYCAWGEQCVTRFNGMWSFALLDLRRKRLFCGRDRWGIKPFHYRWQDNCLTFGSEIKQVIGQSPQANMTALFDVTVLGEKDHLEETCFEGVRQLRGGHCLTLDLAGGSPKISRFYELRIKSEYAGLSLDEASDLVLKTLSDSIRLRLRSDVPVGSCLSGGLDSSAIVSLMSRHRQAAAPQPRQHTFTFVSSDPQWDESRFADQVANAAGVDRHMIMPTADEVRADMVKHLWHQDEPVGSLSTLAQWYVFKAARALKVPVMLDGQGGDELFLGYERYYTCIIRMLLGRGNLPAAARMFALAGMRSRLGHVQQAMRLVYFQLPSVRAARLRLMAGRWLKRDFLRRQRMSARMAPTNMSPDIGRLQLQEVTEVCLPALLRYEDRNSMAFSIESRLPMLDWRLVELAVSLPWSLKMREGWTKFVLRKAVEGVLPPEVTWRRNKFGFVAPQQEWMRIMNDDVKRLVGGDLASAGIVNVDRLRKDIAGGRIGWQVLWRFYNLENWMRLFSVKVG